MNYHAFLKFFVHFTYRQISLCKNKSKERYLFAIKLNFVSYKSDGLYFALYKHQKQMQNMGHLKTGVSKRERMRQFHSLILRNVDNVHGLQAAQRPSKKAHRD